MMCFEVMAMYLCPDAQRQSPPRTVPCRPRTPVSRGPCAAPNPGATAESGGGVEEVVDEDSTNKEYRNTPGALLQ